MKKLGAIAVGLILFGSPALACVGKTLIIGTDRTARGKFVGQVLAILINERTGTTVKVSDFSDAEAIHRGLTSGDVDIAVDYTSRALARLGLSASDAEAALKAVRTAYQEKLNLAWLAPMGFSENGDARSLASPIVRKDTLKKFPALPRLMAKTEGVLSDSALGPLASSNDPARAAREFLRSRKLI